MPHEAATLALADLFRGSQSERAAYLLAEHFKWHPPVDRGGNASAPLAAVPDEIVSASVDAYCRADTPKQRRPFGRIVKTALVQMYGSAQEFDGRPVLWAFRRFYRIFDLCRSRFRGGGVQSRSSDGNRDIDAVVSDSF